MSYYVQVYYGLFRQYWNNLTPSQYGYLLIVVAVAGALMMKGRRR